MAIDLDNPPVYNTITDKTYKLDPIWNDWIVTFIQTLTEYMSQYGIYVPRITLSERDSIISPQNGQMIYNTTSDTFQGFKGGVWTDF